MRWNSTWLSTPLNLTATLTSGQSFRWRRDREGAWWGAVGERAMALRMREGEPDTPLEWQTFPEPDRSDVVVDYLRLDVDLDRLYAEWVAAEPRIELATRRFRGLRILRQPPVECFFAFQCATCNTVVKIERTIARLAERYGRPIRAEEAPFTLYSFPTIDDLRTASEQDLRADLWGYRAPRVIALAHRLRELGPHWLDDLRVAPYPQAHAALSGLFGIGPKVADCICLFALDKDEAVPVDTHVRQIADRYFRPDLAGKTLTPRVYQAVADAYRSRFGPFAGWAQQYLFVGELRPLTSHGSPGGK